MALSSPGVEVKVIDESFYTPAEPGTTPLFIVASASNKSNSGGTGTAPGTLTANAGTVYLLTSQKDLGDTFGDPIFKTDNNNNPIHAGEQNEYGLQAAYSFLGVSNRAFVVRADLDLSELDATPDAPAGYPSNNQYWLDTANTSWGVFEWDGGVPTTTGAGQKFTNKDVIIVNDPTQLTSGVPKSSVGKIGSYAVVTYNTANRMYYRAESGWKHIGSSDWVKSWPTIAGTNSVSGSITGELSITVQGNPAFTTAASPYANLAALATAITTAGTSLGVSAVADTKTNKLKIFYDGAHGTSVTIANVGLGTALTTLGITASTYYPPALQISKHTEVPSYKSSDANPRPTGSVWIKTTEPNSGARWRVKKFNSTTKLWTAVEAPIYSNNINAIYGLDKAGGGKNIAVGSLYVKSNVTGAAKPLADFTLYKRSRSGDTQATSLIFGTSSNSTTFNIGSFQATNNFSISETVANSATTVSSGALSFAKVVGDATATLNNFAAAINSAGLTNVSASVTSDDRLVLSHALGGEIVITDTDGAFLLAGFSETVNPITVTEVTSTSIIVSNWSEADPAKNVFSYVAKATGPTSLTEDGRLWYSSTIDEVDLLVHNGSTWKGYTNVYPNTDPAGPQVAATAPETQSDGTALVTGDIWVSTADMENFPLIYVYNMDLPEASRWVLRDKSDQTTEDGVLFADARYNTAGANSDEMGSIADLLGSDYLDPDAPDPALYPKGMLLWNLRRSGFNVKKFVQNYIDVAGDNERFNNNESMADYYPHRWVTESSNQDDGSGSFGRKAQRKVVVKALQAVTNSNQDIRDEESRVFNLIACPGYPELIGEMISLNYDRGLTAFVVGDTPPRLTPDATSLLAWGSNQRLALEDNDFGGVSYDEYMGMWYPWGFSSDNFGNNIAVPPSHMVLRTIALNDQVAYPWFAPAGIRRGGVTNASAVGYISSEGEFKSVALNTGQRDTLYSVAINPITFLTGSGLVVYGQKTRAKGSSALDRVNVARLVCYLRRQLNALAKPYIFEPNDKITRDQVKAGAESIMLELVGQRALYDYVVVCDESNNTPSRIDRNELWVDIAIEPVKAVEFIYIPLRLKNTGEIKALG
jgi:hypothetical protein